MATQDSEINTFMKGLLIGGVIGAVAGLFLAPKSGKELREDLSRKGAETLDEAKHYYSDTSSKAKAILDDALHRAEELKREAQRHLSEARQKAKEILKEAEDKKGETTQ